MADPSHSSPTAALAEDARLAPMVASDAPETALPAVAPDPDAEFGFRRPEFGKEKLAGTVGLYERHVFLCHKSPAEWPSHLEASDPDSAPRILAAAIQAKQSKLKKSTKLTFCEGEDGTESSLGDVLIFPDMIRYRGLTHLNVDNFVEEVLVKDVEWLPGSPEPINGSYVFVCAHGSRDKRCGVCGPALITRFKEEIEGQGLNGQVAVSACSYMGGHRYAGHIIIFRSDAEGEVTGHWYGYVAPGDVIELLDKHLRQGEIVDHLWRGQLGMTEEERKKALELKHMTNVSVRKGKFVVPEGFDGDSKLRNSNIHGFITAKHLYDAIDKLDTYLQTKMAAALLTNAAIFAVDSKDVREEDCKDGAVGLVDSQGLQLIPTRYDLYTSKIIVKPLLERKSVICPIGGMKIIRRDFGGNSWIRRRSYMEGNDRYQILQWLPRLSDEELLVKKSISHKKKPQHHEDTLGKELQEIDSRTATQAFNQGNSLSKSIPSKKKTVEKEEAIPAKKPIEALETQQHEDGASLANSIIRLAGVSGLTPKQRAKAVLVLKDEDNRIIFSAMQDDEFCRNWFLEEIEIMDGVKERIPERGKGTAP